MTAPRLGLLASPEITSLPEDKQAAFSDWLKANNVTDLDAPDSFYDYRGAFLAGINRGLLGHWPDTYKQHGHPTFSVESQYSAGPGDGGRWDGERFVPADPDTAGLRRRLGQRGKVLDQAAQRTASFEPFSAATKPEWSKAASAEAKASGAYFATQDSLLSAEELIKRILRKKK